MMWMCLSYSIRYNRSLLGQSGELEGMDVPQDAFHLVVEPVKVYNAMRVLQFVVVVLLLVTLNAFE